MLKSVSPRDWGVVSVSIIILGFFGAYEVAVVFLKMPENAGLADTLKILATWVAGYWLGSSRGSQGKDATIAQQAVNTQEALHATPPPPAAKAPGTPVAAFLALAAISLALLLSGQPASAASQPARPPRDGLTRSSEAAARPSLNCGWPVPDPG